MDRGAFNFGLAAGGNIDYAWTVHPIGIPAKVRSWLKKIDCVQFTCESKGAREMPTEVISVRMVCGGVPVPPPKLSEYRVGVPPGRRFDLQP
jgi:hypothetical protein